MSYIVWLSKDKTEWEPLPQEGGKTTHSPKAFRDIVQAESAANQVLCDGEYLYARVVDRNGDLISEIETVE